MKVNLAIRESYLREVIKTNVQKSLVLACLPPIENTSLGTIYIDHLNCKDPVLNPARVWVPLDVYLVTKAQLEQSEDQTPSGALTPAFEAFIWFDLVVSGSSVTLQFSSVACGIPSDPYFQLMQDQLRDLAGGPMSASISTIFQTFKLDEPTTSALVTGPDEFIFEFDPPQDGFGPPLASLPRGEDWCVGISSDVIVQFVKEKIDVIIGQIPRDQIADDCTLSNDTRWEPNGEVAGCTSIVKFDANTSWPPFAHVTITIRTEFFQSFDGIAVELNWVTDIGSGLGWATSVLESLVAGLVGPIFDVATLHATNTIVYLADAYNPGPGKLRFPLKLSTFHFGSLALYQNKVSAWNNALLIAGLGSRPELEYIPRFSLSTGSFGTKYSTYGCWEAGVGANDPLKQKIRDELWTSGEATIWGAGKLSGWEVVSPTPTASFDINNYIYSKSEYPNDSGKFSWWAGIVVSFQKLQALTFLALKQPLKVILRTSRGVRLVTFTNPPDPSVAYDNDGKIIPEKVSVEWTGFCDPVLQHGVDQWFWKLRGLKLHPKVLWDPPLGDPGPEVWSTIEIGLVTVRDLKAGEQLLWDMKDDGGISSYSRDTPGSIIIPTIVTAQLKDPGYTLQKADRSALPAMNFQSKLFMRQGVFEDRGALSHSVSGDSHTAIVTSKLDDGSTRKITISPIGITQKLKNIHMKSAPNKVTSSTSSRVYPPQWEVQTMYKLNDVVQYNGLAYRYQQPGPSESLPGWEPPNTPALWLRAPEFDSPQPRPEPPSPNGIDIHSVNLPGVMKVHLVPGFESENIAIAELDDGTYRALMKDDGKVKVYGVISSWMGKKLNVNGNWALSKGDRGKFGVFKVIGGVTGPGAGGNDRCCCKK